MIEFFFFVLWNKSLKQYEIVLYLFPVHFFVDIFFVSVNLKSNEEYIWLKNKANGHPLLFVHMNIILSSLGNLSCVDGLKLHFGDMHDRETTEIKIDDCCNKWYVKIFSYEKYFVLSFTNIVYGSFRK